MNIENVKVWLAELRSGKWVQGKRYLHGDSDDFTSNPNTPHCCLGVAECLMPVEEFEATRRYPSIRGWLGLNQKQLCVLIDANDGHSHSEFSPMHRFENNPQSFLQIADLVESEEFKAIK